MPKRKSSGQAFTIDTLPPLPVERSGEHWWMDVDGRRLRLSNLDKVFWPKEGYTKGDLLAYYHAVSEWMLPYLDERPLTMKRMPDGIAGPHFYEKEAPSHTPDWIPRCPVTHEDAREGGVVNYMVADSAAALLFVVNLGCIEFHPLHSRCPSVQQPDYLFVDLDPFAPATFDEVRAVALEVRAAVEALGLRCHPKTSGATGMHIYVGIETGPSHDQARELVGAIGRAILRADPGRTTMEWEVSKRSGKVFIDHNMNRFGANIAAVYSVRPEASGTVSMPVTWDEVESGVDPRDFTIVNARERLDRVGDLFAGVLKAPSDLGPIIRSLGLDREEPLPPPRVPRSPRHGRSRPEKATSRPSREAPPPDSPPKAKLSEYSRKRSFDTTPEPPPTAAAAGTGNSFVIQKHNATRLHYDLRLERDSVLVSWAVPKGLPVTVGPRRLAVQTEDHPLEYGSFEGGIPRGEYGGGEVRIFDRGTFEALEWKPEKLTFRLHGERLRGEYHMFKTAKDWLITMSSRSASEQMPPPPPMRPMLAEGGHKPFDDPRWRFEPKLDGVRTLAYVGTDDTRLVSRTGRDQSVMYPELHELAKYVNAAWAVIDGEIVATDENGRSSFQRLQQRINLSSPADVERARRSVPVTLYAFDLLWLDRDSLLDVELAERRRILEEIVTQSDVMRLTMYQDGEGERLFDAAKNLGMEGVIAKRHGSRYTPDRRSKDWRKVKAMRTQDAVILGWTPGAGSRESTFGALLLGAHDDGRLVWIGQVGTGFGDALRVDLLRRLKEVESPEPPIEDPHLRALRAKGARFLRPELVCEVEYLEMTDSGKLRAPSYKGLQPDKLPSDCVLGQD